MDAERGTNALMMWRETLTSKKCNGQLSNANAQFSDDDRYIMLKFCSMDILQHNAKFKALSASSQAVPKVGPACHIRPWKGLIWAASWCIDF